MNFIIKLLATGLFLGYLPGAPGTYASAAAALMWWYLPQKYFYVLFFLFLIIAAYACGRAEVIFGKKDDKKIVIDEFIGIFTAVLFLPKTVFVLVAGFTLFRFFDVKKPFFIKSVQKCEGSAGVIYDDMLAGAVTNIIINLILLFAGNI